MTSTVVGLEEWHVLSDDGDWQDEAIRVGDTAWMRCCADDPDEQWTEVPFSSLGLDDPATRDAMYEDWAEWADDEVHAGLATAMFLGQGDMDPAALARLVTDARDPELVADAAEGTFLRATVPPPEHLADVVPGGVAPVEVTITLDGDVPTRIVTTVEVGSARSEVDLRRPRRTPTAGPPSAPRRGWS